MRNRFSTLLPECAPPFSSMGMCKHTEANSLGASGTTPKISDPLFFPTAETSCKYSAPHKLRFARKNPTRGRLTRSFSVCMWAGIPSDSVSVSTAPSPLFPHNVWRCNRMREPPHTGPPGPSPPAHVPRPHRGRRAARLDSARRHRVERRVQRPKNSGDPSLPPSKRVGEGGSAGWRIPRSRCPDPPPLASALRGSLLTPYQHSHASLPFPPSFRFVPICIIRAPKRLPNAQNLLGLGCILSPWQRSSLARHPPEAYTILRWRWDRMPCPPNYPRDTPFLTSGFLAAQWLPRTVA